MMQRISYLFIYDLLGVIDSSDLPLNVSREILQEHPLVDSIKKALTKRVLDALKKLKKDDMSAYQAFWHEFGLALKEGLLRIMKTKMKLQVYLSLLQVRMMMVK